MRCNREKNVIQFVANQSISQKSAKMKMNSLIIAFNKQGMILTMCLFPSLNMYCLPLSLSLSAGVPRALVAQHRYYLHMWWAVFWCVHCGLTSVYSTNSKWIRNRIEPQKQLVVFWVVAKKWCARLSLSPCLSACVYLCVWYPTFYLLFIFNWLDIICA